MSFEKPSNRNYMKRLAAVLTCWCTILMFSIPAVMGQSGQKASPSATGGLIMPYLKNCKDAASDAERYQCTLDELVTVLKRNFVCPWRDLDGEYSRIILRFMVNNDGNLERFLTLYSDNVANRPSDNFNAAMIRAVNSTSGQWVPVKESGKAMPREFVLPLECNCTDDKAPDIRLLDTIPAYYADGHFQLEGFIEKNIVFPDGFLSKSGRQTTALLKANINPEGKLDTTTIRVINLNSIDYRLSENAIHILLNLAKRPWKPAMVRGGGPISYEMYFKVTYVDDKNPRKGSVPMEWDITVGNNHFFNSGAMEFTGQNYITAIELFKRAVYLDPDDRESWLMLGQSYIGAGQNTNARVALQRAINLGSKEAETWMKDAQKPDVAEPAPLPEKEVKKRPIKTEKVKPVGYGGAEQAKQPEQPQQPQQQPEQQAPENNPKPADQKKPASKTQTKAK